MQKPQITVVTVCYNAEYEIENTIQSVVNQTYENIEYIIIDGASKDGTMQIVEKYRDKLAIVVSEPDKGIYDAMNKAITLASGDWINFMNAGDSFVSCDVIEDVFTNREIDDFSVLYGDSYLVFPFGKVLSKTSGSLVFNGILPFSHQSVFVRTNVMKIYGFDIKFKVLADLNFFKRLYNEEHKFMKVDLPISNYELGGFSEKNIDLAFYENELIQQSNDTIGYILRLTKHKIRLQILRLLPQNITLEIRKIRYKLTNRSII